MKKTVGIGIVVSLIMFAACHGANNTDANKPGAADSLANKQTSLTGQNKNPAGPSYKVSEFFTSEMNNLNNVVSDEAAKESAKWKKPAKLALMYMQDSAKFSNAQLGLIRYFYLLSFAGEVIKKVKTHDDLKNELNRFIGKEIIVNHMVVMRQDGQPFNFIDTKQDSGSVIKVTIANNKGTYILGFINVHTGSPVNLSDDKGKYAYLGGILKSFDISRDDVFSWVMTLNLDNGYILLAN
jgi:hypothetical protein